MQPGIAPETNLSCPGARRCRDSLVAMSNLPLTGRRFCHDDSVSGGAGMPFSQMLAVLDAVRSVGCRFWVEGGWGVDALVGHQTRPHRDVDIAIDGTFEDQVLGALQKLGYTIES